MYINQTENEEERQALIELMQVENYEQMQSEIKGQIDSIRQQQSDSQQRFSGVEKESRHSRRASKKYEKFSNVLSEASGMDFEDEGSQHMTMEDIDQSLMGMS